jgi:hypothetical protein
MNQFDSWADGRPAAAGGRTAVGGGVGRAGTLPTGHPDTDAAVASLADLDTVSLEEHVERYTQAHRTLQQILRTIDAA